ncbi:Reverse transcriptase (RNA-dependent DNA polymerase), partial [Pristimantis euphronides]
MEEYFRRLRLKEFFHDRENAELVDTQTQEGSRAKKESDWTPQPGRNSTLDKYINTFRCVIQSTILDKQKDVTSNINLKERKALKNLKNNKEIIIKPADKGGAIVLTDTSDYIKEADRQLNDTRYYTKLEHDPTPNYMRELRRIIRNLSVEPTKLLAMIPENPRVGIFYLLPKIHKPGNPGRPIISCVETLTESISGWVEGVLKPVVKNTTSYLQDTTDLLNKLSTIGPLSNGAILVTMDVESLYFNIPHEDGLTACQEHLEANGIASESVLQLTKFILTHNYFSFDKEIYLQLTGTAMGSKMAPQYANLFMAKLKRDFLASCTTKPLAYFRYIDDIILIWTDSEQELIDFHKRFNEFHPTINLTMDYSYTEINFLDTTIKIQDNLIQTS